MLQSKILVEAGLLSFDEAMLCFMLPFLVSFDEASIRNCKHLFYLSWLAMLTKKRPQIIVNICEGVGIAHNQN